MSNDLKIPNFIKLPAYITKDGIGYKLVTYPKSEYDVTEHDPFTGTLYECAYLAFDGEKFNYDIQKVEFSYIVAEHELNEKQLQYHDFSTKYAKSLDDVKSMINEEIHKQGFIEVDEILSPRQCFTRELSSLFNRYSVDNEFNMADYVLADYVNGTLDSLYELSKRTGHIGHKRKSRFLSNDSQ